MVMNDWLTSLSFHVNQPSHSSHKAISNFDLEPTRSMPLVWSKGKTIQSAEYLIDMLSFCFKSIRQQFLRYSYFEIWYWKIKGQGHGWGHRSRSISSPSIQPMYLIFVSHRLDQPFLRYVQLSVWPWKNTSEIFKEISKQKNSFQ